MCALDHRLEKVVAWAVPLPYLADSIAGIATVIGPHPAPIPSTRDAMSRSSPGAGRPRGGRGSRPGILRVAGAGGERLWFEVGPSRSRADILANPLDNRLE